MTAHAGPCTTEIERLKSEIDTKVKAQLAGNPSVTEGVAAAIQGQSPSGAKANAPTAQSVAPLEHIGTVYLALAQAMAADTIGDKGKCDQAVADARTALNK
jgi:uncharacterized membrane-anchored protein